MPIRRRPKVATLIDYDKYKEPWAHILKSINFTPETHITADDMKKAGKTWTGQACQFEPRLLAYQPLLSSRPSIFKDNNIYILPIKNGTYILTNDNIYKELLYEDVPIINVTKDTLSTVLTIGNSETSIIDNLRYSGVFERPEILGEPITHGPLLNGRHRCDIDITLGGKPLEIRGVQYEVDSCFESKNKILLIEGKSSTKQIDSFNIRQLFFPYKVLHTCKKEIVCLFIHELNSIVNIWKFTFEDSTSFNSIKQLGYYRYKFNS